MAMDVEEMHPGLMMVGWSGAAMRDATRRRRHNLMGAASAGLPAIVVPRRTSAQQTSGKTRSWARAPTAPGKLYVLSLPHWQVERRGVVRVGGCSARRLSGHCMVMGTASTMASITEASG